MRGDIRKVWLNYIHSFWNYHLTAAVCHPSVDDATKICIFQFVFKDPDNIDVEELMRSDLPVLELTVASSQDLTVFCGGWHGSLRLVVVDCKQDRRCVIDSGLTYVSNAL